MTEPLEPPVPSEPPVPPDPAELSEAVERTDSAGHTYAPEPTEPAEIAPPAFVAPARTRFADPVAAAPLEPPGNPPSGRGATRFRMSILSGISRFSAAANRPWWVCAMD